MPKNWSCLAVALAIMVTTGCNLPGTGGHAYLGPGKPTATGSNTATAAASSGQQVVPANVEMMNAQAGWGWSPQRITRTDDGGKSWRDVTPAQPVDGNGQPGVFDFYSAERAWVGVTAGDHLVLYATADGGSNWEMVGRMPPATFGCCTIALDFADPSKAWLSLRDAGMDTVQGQLMVTADGGKTWTKREIPFGGQISFLPGGVGWVAGAPRGTVGPAQTYGYSWLFATHDGARSWSHVSLSVPEVYRLSMLFVEPPRFFGSQDGILPVRFFQFIQWGAGRPGRLHDA